MHFRLDSLSPEQLKKLNAIGIKDDNGDGFVDDSEAQDKANEINSILSSDVTPSQNKPLDNVAVQNTNENCGIQNKPAMTPKHNARMPKTLNSPQHPFLNPYSLPVTHNDINYKTQYEIYKERLRLYEEAKRQYEYAIAHPYMMSDQQDGVIGDFRQGEAGDCWFLAVVANLKDLPDHGRGILKETIKNNKNGTYTVNFKGGDGKPITITEEEVQRGTIKVKGKDLVLSRGDKDVRILELAANKYIGMHPEQFDNAKNIFGNNEKYAWQLLTNSNLYREFSRANIRNKPSNILDKFAYMLNKEELREMLWAVPADELVCHFPDNKNILGRQTNAIEQISGNQKIYRRHAYNISGVTKEHGQTMLTLINPHDTSKPIKISFEEAYNLGIDVEILVNANAYSADKVAKGYAANPFRYYN